MKRRVVIAINPETGQHIIREKKSTSITEKILTYGIALTSIVISAMLFTREGMIDILDIVAGVFLLFIGCAMIVGEIRWRDD